MIFFRVILLALTKKKVISEYSLSETIQLRIMIQDDENRDDKI